MPELPTAPPAVTDPIAIVVAPGDWEAVYDYADRGPVLSPFKVVMTAKDVPPRLSGMALLCESVPQDVQEALLLGLGVRKAAP